MASDELSPRWVHPNMSGSRANERTFKVMHQFCGYFTELFYKTVELVKVPSLTLSLVIYPLDAWAVQSGSLLLQFASQRMQWSLGHSAYLISIRAAVALLLTLGILPVLNQYLCRRVQIRPFKIDTIILRISYLAACVGYLLIGGSNSQGLLILGQSSGRFIWFTRSRQGLQS